MDAALSDMETISTSREAARRGTPRHAAAPASGRKSQFVLPVIEVPSTSRSPVTLLL